MGIKILIVQNNMYKKKSSTIAVMFVLLLTCSLISCDNKNNTSQTPSTHVHDYSDVWNHDETQHWHTCKDSSCGEKKDASNHTFNWSEKTPAGVHKDKVEKVFVLFVVMKQLELLKKLQFIVMILLNGFMMKIIIGMLQIVMNWLLLMM